MLFGCIRRSSILKSGNKVNIVSTRLFCLFTDTLKEKKRKSNVPYKFLDKVEIEVKGGKGGNGCISFEVMSPGKKRPEGGNGGKGGNVYMIADKSMTTISLDTFHFKAENGKNGSGKGATGKSGEDVFIRVPCGVVLCEVNKWEGLLYNEIGDNDDIEEYEEDSDEIIYEQSNDELGSDLSHTEDVDAHDDVWETSNESEVRSFELSEHNQIILLARGGVGGQGNLSAKRSLNRKPSVAGQVVKGRVGEVRTLLLELKLIADVGLVGYPNSGKSTLLRALSNANPKIASYPFTTLHPNIGVMEYSDGTKVSVADIPGIIEGASVDRGLGLEFLKHIERTKCLVYVVDLSIENAKGRSIGRKASAQVVSSASEAKDPLTTIKMLRNELCMYDESLLNKPSIIFANKADLCDQKSVRQLHKLKEYSDEQGIILLSGSAKNGDFVHLVAENCRKLLDTNKK